MKKYNFKICNTGFYIGSIISVVFILILCVSTQITTLVSESNISSNYEYSKKEVKDEEKVKNKEIKNETEKNEKDKDKEELEKSLEETGKNLIKTAITILCIIFSLIFPTLMIKILIRRSNGYY